MKRLFFVLAGSLFLLTACRNQSPQMPANHYLAVGTYTQQGSEGIYLYNFDENSGKLTAIGSKSGIVNPSFVIFSSDKKHLYAASETKVGEVVAYDFAEGRLTERNRVDAGGESTCHLRLDTTERWLLASNYSSGTVSSLSVNLDGSLGSRIQTIQHIGSGPDKTRQEKPHVHSATVSPDNKMVFVADLGIDKLMGYALDAATGQLTLQQEVAVSAGSGPRHFTFHPNKKWAYVIQELIGKITAYAYDNQRLTAIEEVSTLPENFTGKNSCADIHISPDGRFLYGSNRFYDTIVTFSIDQKTGRLTQLSQTPVGGKTPRNFALSPSGKYVIVANQQSDNLVVFARNPITGQLTPTGETATVSMPVCLAWGGRNSR